MRALILKLLDFRLFARREAATTPMAVIKWWELRRIPYNLVVATTGIVTCVIVLLEDAMAANVTGAFMAFPNPPVIGVIAIILYGLMANVCYTGGWITELLVRAIWRERAGDFGPITFALGFLLSVLLTLAPIVLVSALILFSLTLR